MAIWNKDSQAYLANNKTLFEAFLLADKDGNVINSFGVASNIPIAGGFVDGYSAIHKFGRNPNVGNVPETIWMYGGIYQYLDVGSDSTVYAYSASTDDGPGNDGARTVTVQGLDNDFNPIEETITVNGAASTASFLRVYRAFVATAGVLAANDGDVIISTAAAGGGTVLADIGVIGSGTTTGLGQTQLALYTIPAGKTGYLTTWNVGVSPMNNAVTVTLNSRELDGSAPFRSRDIMDIVGGYTTQNYSIPIRFPEKTDIEVRAAGDTGSVISSSFDIILVDNEA
jgi:hypothetical protein